MRRFNTLTSVAHCDYTQATAFKYPDVVRSALILAGAGVFQIDLPEARARWRRETLEDREEVA